MQVLRIVSVVYRPFRKNIILLVAPQRFCISIVCVFSWDHFLVPREPGNKAYAKCGGTKRGLWYFPKWPIESELGMQFEIWRLELAIHDFASFKHCFYYKHRSLKRVPYFLIVVIWENEFLCL